MGAPAIARRVATRVLFRVATEAAWASRALDAEITRAAAGERDAALATEIVYGTLRALPSIDRAIELRRANRGAIEAFAHAAMRAAAYQLLHLRTPAHAVVDDAVSIVREARGEGLARFANAVLRRIAEARPAVPVHPRTIEVPPWVATEIERGLGPARAAAFLGARALPPALPVRVSTHLVSREALAERLRRARPDGRVAVTGISPLGLLLWRAGDPRRLPGWDEGLFAVQDEGSQIVALALEARAGERIADACAGRGGKTAVLLAAVGESGSVTAIDLHEPKLDRIGDEVERLRLPRARLTTCAIDLSVGIGGLPEGTFDRVLVDAPCTGLGTIHRRPELLLRLAPGDIPRMAELQRRIAASAVRLLRPGGVLVYAVCSPVRAEGAEVVDALERALPGLVRLRAPIAGIPAPIDDDGVLRLGPFTARGTPTEHGPDAYQLCRLQLQRAI